MDKRKRERSFDYLEKSILIEIVTEHFGVIESKKTDGVSIKLKNAEWQKIAEKFAASSSTYSRDSHSLKMLWDNLKRKAKAAMAIQADNIYGTGGGKAKKSVADPIVDAVVGLIRPNVEPFNNIYDDNNYEECRSNVTTKTNQFEENEEIIVEHVELSPEAMINNDFDNNDILLQNDWSQYNPAMMKTQISSALRNTSQESRPIPSTSKIPPDIDMPEDIRPTAASSPYVEGKKGVSRRRPALTRTSASETFLEAKKLCLDASRTDAEEEHKLQMKILNEKLKQEKMKTELLKLQIQRESGTEWVFDDNNDVDNTD